MSADQKAKGIQTIASTHSVSETLGKLKGALASRGIMLFAVIDHSGETDKAGLHMPDTKLAIFGNPKAGTPVMLAAPLIAIDLPLKILIWEDAGGNVWISYTRAEYLEERYGLTADAIGPLNAVAAVANAIAQ